MRGYAKGVRFGHAGGHLRGPLVEAVEDWQTGRIKHWSDFFESKEVAREHVGKLWHCTDILSGDIRRLVSEEFDRPVGTFGQLARLLLGDLRRS